MYDVIIVGGGPAEHLGNPNVVFVELGDGQ